MGIRNFLSSIRVQTDNVAHEAASAMYTWRSFPGGGMRKAAGAWRCPPTTVCSRGQDPVKLYLFCAFMACDKVNITFLTGCVIEILDWLRILAFRE